MIIVISIKGYLKICINGVSSTVVNNLVSKEIIKKDTGIEKKDRNWAKSEKK